MRKLPSRLKIRLGFTLVEVGIAAVVAGVAATATLYYQAQEMRYQLAHAQVDQLKVLSASLAKYQNLYSSAILSGGSVSGVAVPTHPTVAELKALNLLEPSFSAVNLYSTTQGYHTLVRPSPLGCSGASCGLFGMAYLDTPVLDAQGAPDNASVGEAMMYGGGNVGVSTNVDKTTIRGANNMWNEPSPVPGSAAILAMRSSGGGNYVAIDGSSTMTGSLKMGGNDVTGVNNFVGTGTVSASSVTAANAVTANTMTASGNITGSNVAASNNVSGNAVYGNYVQSNGTVQALGNVLANGSVQAAGGIYGSYVQSSGSASVSGDLYANTVTTNYERLNGTLSVASGTTIANDGRQHINANENLYLQPWSGGTTNVGGGGGSGQLNVYGNISTATNWWGMIARDAGGADNVNPQSAAGSLYVNDIWVRSVGKWASQLGGTSKVMAWGGWSSGTGWQYAPNAKVLYVRSHTCVGYPPAWEAVFDHTVDLEAVAGYGGFYVHQRGGEDSDREHGLQVYVQRSGDWLNVWTNGGGRSMCGDSGVLEYVSAFG